LQQAASDNGGERKALSWNHVRLSVVVPISIIVAVAIGCVVVAVYGSAHRADEVALANERQLFTRALNYHADRVLREVDSVATSDAAIRNIRLHFDPEWVQARVGLRLQSYFDQDFVFIANGSDKFIYALLGQRSVDPNWFNSIQPDLNPVLDVVRGRAAGDDENGVNVVSGTALRATAPSACNRSWAGQRLWPR
jgi:sensor domain CHASE-containing protein